MPLAQGECEKGAVILDKLHWFRNPTIASEPARDPWLVSCNLRGLQAYLRRVRFPGSIGPTLMLCYACDSESGGYGGGDGIVGGPVVVALVILVVMTAVLVHEGKWWRMIVGGGLVWLGGSGVGGYRVGGREGGG